MNKYAIVLAALGILAGTACKSSDASSSYEVSDPMAPITLDISGMT
jgi:hypothetical protein